MANGNGEDDPLRVLVIDDDPGHSEVVCEALGRKGYECDTAAGGREGLDRLRGEVFDLVLTDLRMAGTGGMDVVRAVRSEHPETEVMVLTGHGEVKSAVEALRLGATHYLQKPIDMNELRAVVGQAAGRAELARANRDLRRQLDERFGFEGVVGNSPKMQAVIKQLRAYAATQATVLILGENGTGKDIAARALHHNSPRRKKPFVALNCASLNENLLDDEMFGHEPGAFTGAAKQRKGRFEAADGGTLFLDEIGDMPLTLQAKLLRVLENKEIVRVGSNDPIKVDVRVVAATNRDLQQSIADGQFREDLFYRLRVGVVRLPALRERREDIPMLAAHFLKEFNRMYGKEVTGLGEDVRRAFAAYNWPGNVRELRNTLENMVILDGDGVLGGDDIPDGVGGLSGVTGRAGPASGSDHLIGRPLAEVERYYAERALELANNNREEASRTLGIGERTLYRMIQRWKQQDRIQEALAEAGGDHAAAADALEMSPDALERELKKLGVREEE